MEIYAQKAITFNSLTIENGLSQNSVLSITQDKQQFMWFGTNHGLNRYDGYQFKIYLNDPTDSESVSSNSISCVFNDSKGRLWVGTSKGLNKYDKNRDAFTRISKTSGSGLSNNAINCIYEDDQKNLWIGTSSGLNLLAHGSRKFKSFFFGNKEAGNRQNQIYSIFKDNEGDLWLGTVTGLIRMSLKKGHFNNRIFRSNKNPESISSNYITSINADAQQNLWIGTDNGLNLYNKATRTFTVYKHNAQDPNTIVHNDIRKINPDKKGMLWISTQEGLSILNPVAKTFTNYQHDPEVKSSLSHNSTHDIFFDITGNVWIGTYYGGVNMVSPYAKVFYVYENSKIRPSISSNIISSIVEDAKQNLWIGTEGGGLDYFDRKNNIYQHYKISSIPGAGPSSNLIKTIHKSRDGNLLIGTHHGGLNVFDPTTRRFQNIINIGNNNTASTSEIVAINETSNGDIWIGSHSGLTNLKRTNGVYDHITTKSPVEKLLSNKRIEVIFEDKDKNVWIGTTGGLFVYDYHTGKVTSHFKNEVDLNALQSDHINCLLQDTEGKIYIGTYYGGVSVYDPLSKKFKTYTEKNSLSNNNVLAMVEDRGTMWISTDNGLSKLDLKTSSFRNYTKSDGLAGNDFNLRSAFKDSYGILFFGGHSGLTAFNPSQIQVNNHKAPIVFTGLKLFNEQVKVNAPDNLLKESINNTEQIKFKHDQNHFTIGFALLSYVKSDKNRYVYKLQGYDKDWNEVSSPSATYTNLPSGSYSFTVKGTNNDGISGGESAVIDIKILPPLWASWWAYFAYLLIFSIILFLTIRYLFLRALLKRSENVQQMKLNFFTYISHEIRTPLTLIVGPLESLLKSTKDNFEVNDQVTLVKNNADRLLRLVTELMDFRKAESGHLKLNVSKTNIVDFTRNNFRAFSHEALNRTINYTFNCELETIDLFFDKMQMEKVLFNLLSNAFKFTDNGGRITVSIENLDQEVEIRVKDNGKGIPYESQSKLFSDFFQIDESGSSHIGSGIGLALSKSIIDTHKGNILIKSNPATSVQLGETCFTVMLKKGKDHFKASELAGPIYDEEYLYTDLPELVSNDLETTLGALSPETILIIEDNEEIKEFISSFMGKHYHIETSENGLEGWETAIELLPDLIICDVMMPIMDGLELCAKLKTDERTSHIPVVLLTARSSHTHQVSGLETGADAYITKPFSMELLQLNVRNLLSTRVKMREKYSQEVSLQPQNITVNSTDHIFMTKIIQYIETNMEDQNFGVPELSVEMGMSQPVLYKKVRALTDLSVNDFIKSIRLKKAAQLLELKTYTISEVSYLVGFNDPKYFSREFKKQFGETPRVFINTMD
ncbi:hybrid sensor histidine kinase/response regulator transcription factor [Pedobacter frigoris]|nr:hybrid sensor histidine kinase/response regulator transcription factor [Pedobacter frigoris]